MIGFIIKKSFFDAWDNLLRIVIFNFLTIPFLALAYWGVEAILNSNFLGFVLVFISLVALLIHQGTVSYFFRDIGNSQSVTLRDYFKYLKTDFGIKLKFSIAWAIFINVTFFSLFYYYSRFLKDNSLHFMVLLGVVFWFSLMTSIAVLFFYPIKVRLQGNFRRVLKKCFILMFDNPLTVIFVFIYSIILFILSCFTLGLLPPGLSGISCLLDTTIHMLELKYDYLEANPDADRKKIPWIELTYELNENIGPRTIKGMIFPWKD